MARADVERAVRQVAQEAGFPDPDLLVATVWQESNFNPAAVGDQGHSVGPFQEHDKGRGAGLSSEQRQDVRAATLRAIAEFKNFYAPGIDPGTWAARAQRPLDPKGYAQQVNEKYQKVKGSPATGPLRARLWPFEGFDPSTTRITTRFGGAQTITPGYEKVFAGKPKGPGGEVMNTGVDYAVPEGTRIRAPEDAEVSDVKTVDGQHYGYGNSVELKFGDGTRIRFSHLKDVPAVKVGQKLSQGQVFGRTGATGNATGPHTDGEARDAKGNYIDSLKWLSGASGGNIAVFGGNNKAWSHQGRVLQQYTPPDIKLGEVAPLGWSAEEILAETGDIRYAQVPAPRTLNSRKGPMTNSGFVGTNPATTVAGLSAISGPDGATLQAMFNMMLSIVQNTHATMGTTGQAPEMVWDPEAFDDGQGNAIGAFVPTGRTAETLAAVNQRYNLNRSQISTIATLAAQSGMVPMVDMNEDGLIYQVFNERGAPQFLETVESRNQRASAGAQTGFVPRDTILPQSTARPMIQNQGPIAGQAPPPPPAEAVGPAPTEPSVPGAPEEGFPGDPVIGEGNFVDTNGIQFPSGRDPVTGLPQGSAYSVNPDPMDTAANQAWLAAQPAPSVVPLNVQPAPVDQPMEALEAIGYENQ